MINVESLVQNVKPCHSVGQGQVTVEETQECFIGGEAQIDKVFILSWMDPCLYATIGCAEEKEEECFKNWVHLSGPYAYE